MTSQALEWVQPRKAELALLSISSLGIVYGDIGTSPLYAIRECFRGEHSVPVTHDNILGILSLVFWGLTLIVSAKYVIYVLRADNRGEGGILALMSLALSRYPARTRGAGIIALLGLAGAVLLYGDGVITPAISVLSAVEGLDVAVPGLERFVLPATLLILALLFSVQRRGSGRVGAVFGPVMLVWFFAIAVVGLAEIVATPQVLQALNPLYAVHLVVENGVPGFLVLGAVFLAFTGAEALYADMGHFGRRPIRVTWFSVVKPALVLNYFGQGALLMTRPESAENPFYYLVPAWGRLPMVVLATAATVIASQALISGAFSLTRQASMLGYWPRVAVRHTSARKMGQIYVPVVNWLLFIATCALVIGFGSSAGLAGAYGVAVTGTMLITTLLAFVVSRRVWRFSLVAALLLTAVLIVPDVSFFAANLVKIPYGGWVPLLLGVVLLVLMTTWKKGRTLLGVRMLEGTVTLDEFRELMRIERPARVPGTAVFMTAVGTGAPAAMLRNFEHNRVVHEHNILLTVLTTDAPRASEEERLRVIDLGDGFVRIEARYGFMEEPDVPSLLARAALADVDLDYVSYFFGREILLADNDTGMRRWRKRLFTFMAHNSLRATAFFRIPPAHVVELGTHVEL